MDELWQEAFAQAQEALENTEVPIGCIIYDPTQQTIISIGRNYTNELRNATTHAEMQALKKVTDMAMLSRCSLVVTIEPCIMCIAALRKVGLTKIWAAARNERFGGCGSVASAHNSMMDEGVPVADVHIQTSGKWWREAILLLRKFYLMENERAPKAKKKAHRTLKEPPVQIFNGY